VEAFPESEMARLYLRFAEKIADE
jgi:hypothetical protein